MAEKPLPDPIAAVRPGAKLLRMIEELKREAERVERQ